MSSFELHGILPGWLRVWRSHTLNHDEKHVLAHTLIGCEPTGVSSWLNLCGRQTSQRISHAYAYVRTYARTTYVRTYVCTYVRTFVCIDHQPEPENLHVRVQTNCIPSPNSIPKQLPGSPTVSPNSFQDPPQYPQTKRTGPPIRLDCKVSR